MLVCVVFFVLLVAPVLASMRLLLCGGDGSNKETTKSVITQQIPATDFLFTITVLINSKKKIRPASNYAYYGFLLIRKQLNLHLAFL